MRPLRFVPPALVAGLLALGSFACGSGSDSPAPRSSVVDAVDLSGTGPVELRLGYFPNVTHAAAVAGVEKGIFSAALGEEVNLQPATFNAGPAAIEALFSGALDATYIGPNPAINAYARSDGEAVRIIAGATSGGAFLVVDPTIGEASDLRGKKLATPQLGNTQDVALRAWLAGQGFKTTLQGGGGVSVVPQENAQILEQFKSGAISGAWVPEPWATRLVLEGGGKVLVDERTLWPGGRFVTTHLIVRTEFLREHPQAVERLLQGHLAATEFVTREPAEARAVVNAGIERITSKAVPEAVIAGAWENLAFTFDPLADSLRQGAAAAKAVGLLDPGTRLEGIYDLTLLNKLLAAGGQGEVEG